MKTAISFISLMFSALFPFRNAVNMVFYLTSVLKQTTGNWRFLIAGTLLLLCMLQYNISSAQSDDGGVWQYNEALEHDDLWEVCPYDLIGCECSNSYMENDALDNEPSTELINSVEGWMSKLDDDLYLSQISIPGTHDAGAIAPALVGVATQTWNIYEQLKGGIRYFDIRVNGNAAGTGWYIVHGDYCIEGQDGKKLTFDKVYDQMSRFLSEPGNSNETIIMSIQNEGSKTEDCNGEEKTNENFTAIRDSIDKDNINYPFFNMHTSMPKLKDVRGEIVAINAIPGTYEKESIESFNILENLVEYPNFFLINIKVRENASGTSWDLYNGSYCTKDQNGERLTFDKVYNQLSQFLSDSVNNKKNILLTIVKEPLSAPGDENFCDGIETTNDNFDAIINGIDNDSINYPLFNLPGSTNNNGQIIASYVPDETSELNVIQQNVWSVWFVAEDCAGVGNGSDCSCSLSPVLYPFTWLLNLTGLEIPNCLNKDQATLPAKERLVMEYIDMAAASNTNKKSDRWIINYLSGAVGMTPACVAAHTNDAAFQHLNTKTGKTNVGTLVMDYPGEGLIYRIIKTNFQHKRRVDLSVQIDCWDSDGGFGHGTDDKITVKFYNGDKLIGTQSRSYTDFTDIVGTTTFDPQCNSVVDSYFDLEDATTDAMPQLVTHFTIETSGTDAFAMDHVSIDKIEYAQDPTDPTDGSDALSPNTTLKKFGEDGEGAYCLSQDSEDDFGSFAPTCYPCLRFEVTSGKVYPCNSSSQLMKEIQYYAQSCVPLEDQLYTQNGQEPALSSPLCGPDFVVNITEDFILEENFSIPYQSTMNVMSGVVLIIPQGMVLTINSESTLNNFGSIINQGKIIVYSEGTIENKTEALIDSPGQLFNFGETVNQGEIYNPIGYYGQGQGGNAPIVNPIVTGYLLSVDSLGGRYVCENLLKSTTSLTKGSWDAASNTCTIDDFWLEVGRTLIVDEGVNLVINEILNSDGIIYNYGGIDGTINNCGAYMGPNPAAGILDSCELSQDAIVCKQLGGHWDEGNQSCLLDTNSVIPAGSILTISAGVTYYIQSPLSNEGTIVNNGILINESDINNLLDAEINNYGVFEMSYQSSSGIGSTIVNYGEIQNYETFHNIEDIGNGGITGSGIFNNLCGAEFIGPLPDITEGAILYFDWPENTPPVALTRNITILLDTTCQAAITPADIDNGSSDNCEIVSMTLNQTEFDCSDVGENLVTLTVTDESGNITKADAVVTVEDIVPPEIESQITPFIIQLNADGNSSITPADVYVGSIDSSQIASLWLSQYDFNWCHEGENSITLTVTDNSGNPSTAQYNVIVENSYTPYVTLAQITTCGETGSIAVDVVHPYYSYSFDGGETFGVSNIKSGLEAGTYSVIVKNEEGCTSATTLATITFPDLDGDGICDDSIPTGIDDELLVESIRLYPNPASNVLTIEAEIPITKVEFYSFIGNKVKEVHSDFKSISLNNLSNGVYLVKVYSENGFENKKMVKH